MNAAIQILFDFAILDLLVKHGGSCSGKKLRELLARCYKIKKNGPSFYMAMSHVEEKKWAEHRDDEKEHEGFGIKERIFTITDTGRQALSEYVATGGKWSSIAFSWDFRFALPVIDVPEYINRRIVWNKEREGGQVILLVGYCPQTLPYYLGMVADILKTFPDVDQKEIQLGHVTQSSNVKGFTLLIANIKGPKREIPGYTEYDSIDFNW
jgi:hypothetical protein